MNDDEIMSGTVIEESWLTLEQLATTCRVEPAWLIARFEAGLFDNAECVAGTWHMSTGGLTRARRMWQLERDFDAVPELAALMADLLEELDALRTRVPSGRTR